MGWLFCLLLNMLALGVVSCRLSKGAKPVDATTVLALIPPYVGLILTGVIYFRQEREQKRSDQWKREVQEQQQHNELILNQPSLVAIGNQLAIHHEVVPQWLDADAAQQRITIKNRGKTTPSGVQVVLFPRASNLPASSPSHARTNELFGTYWEGELDDGPEPDKQVELVLYSKRFPLRGDMSIIPGRTLFAPPEPDIGTALGAGTALGVHHYFGRLTIMYRDTLGRLLAADLDGESVPHENTLTQKWRPGVGPVVVAQDMRMLTDEALQNAKPPIIG
jgi:hypothetical protein